MLFWSNLPASIVPVIISLDERGSASMNTCWKSRIGWVLLAAYFILAGHLFHQALTCKGWVCDLVALPAACPLGFPIAWLFDGIDYLFVLPDLTSGLLRKWYFILPTVLANSIFYFWVGWQLEKLVRRLLPGSEFRQQGPHG